MSPSPPPPLFLQTRYLFNIQLCFFYTAVFFSSTSLFLSSCEDFSGDDFERRLKVPPPLFFLLASMDCLCIVTTKVREAAQTARWIVGKTGKLLSTVAGRADGRKLRPACLGMILGFACVSPTTIWTVLLLARTRLRVCAPGVGRIGPCASCHGCRSWVKLCSAGSQPAKQSFPVSFTSLAKVVLHRENSNNNLWEH